MIPALCLLLTSFFLKNETITFIAFSLKDSQKIFIQYLPLYTPCLFSMFLNDDVVDIEKSDEICSFPIAVEC